MVIRISTKCTRRDLYLKLIWCHEFMSKKVSIMELLNSSLSVSHWWYLPYCQMCPLSNSFSAKRMQKNPSICHLEVSQILTAVTKAISIIPLPVLLLYPLDIPPLTTMTLYIERHYVPVWNPILEPKCTFCHQKTIFGRL